MSNNTNTTESESITAVRAAVRRAIDHKAQAHAELEQAYDSAPTCGVCGHIAVEPEIDQAGWMILDDIIGDLRSFHDYASSRTTSREADNLYARATELFGEAAHAVTFAQQMEDRARYLAEHIEDLESQIKTGREQYADLATENEQLRSRIAAEARDRDKLERDNEFWRSQLVHSWENERSTNAGNLAVSA